MAVRKVEIEESKETAECWDALEQVIKAARKANADGFQVGQDVPAILMESFAHLQVAIQGMDQLGEEHKSQLKQSLVAHANGGARVAGALFEPLA